MKWPRRIFSKRVLKNFKIEEKEKGCSMRWKERKKKAGKKNKERKRFRGRRWVNGVVWCRRYSISPAVTSTHRTFCHASSSVSVLLCVREHLRPFPSRLRTIGHDMISPLSREFSHNSSAHAHYTVKLKFFENKTKSHHCPIRLKTFTFIEMTTYLEKRKNNNKSTGPNFVVKYWFCCVFSVVISTFIRKSQTIDFVRLAFQRTHHLSR